MKIPYQDEPRKVVPRWRDAQTSARLGELNGIGNQKPVALLREDVLARRRTEWQENKSLAYAADYLATALVMDQLGPAQEAIDFVLAETTDGEDSLRDLAVHAKRRLNDSSYEALAQYPLFHISRDELFARVRALRARLHEEPRNAIGWVDLALTYTDLGQHEPAARAMEVALKLTPDNRFVLRSASRFFVHVKEQDRALRTLRASAASRADPWLAAAEIAVADSIGRTPRLVKEGRRLLRSKSLGHFSTSELASALGTLELVAGSGKEGRRLLRASVLDPTDNSLAQIEWVSRKFKSVKFDRSRLREVPAAHEATALSAFRDGDWQRSLDSSVLWLRDEPFSSEAAVFASYVASIGLGDHREALRILDAGLIANRDHWLLLNNQAFALVNLNEIAEASAVLSKVGMSGLNERERAVIRATQGAIHFRRGEHDSGRAAYREAIEALSVRGQEQSRAVAFLCWAREEALVGEVDVTALLSSAIGSSSSFVEQNPDIRALFEDVRRLEQLHDSSMSA